MNEDKASAVSALMDDELPRAQRRAFEWHIRLCRECREYLQAYRTSLEVGKSLLPGPDDPLPDDVPQELIDAVLTARK